MRKSTRALAGLVLIETLLFGGAAWMLSQVRSGGWTAPNPAEAIATITQVAGAAMGIVAAVLLVTFFVHRRKGN